MELGLGVLSLRLADSQEDEYPLRGPDPDSYSDGDGDRARQFGLSRELASAQILLISARM